MPKIIATSNGAYSDQTWLTAQKATAGISQPAGISQCIDPGGATICSDPLPRLPQDVTPVDAVIQGMETPTLRLLGRSP